MHNYSGALEDTSQILESVPNYAEAYILQGDAFLATNRSDAAQKCYSACLHIDPSIRRSKSFKLRNAELEEKLAITTMPHDSNCSEEFCKTYSRVGIVSTKRKKNAIFCSSHSLIENGVHRKENSSRRFLLFVLVSSGLSPTLESSGKTKIKNPYDEKRLLEQNKRRQRENNVPEDFPNFIREGFEVKVVASENYKKSDSGLIYRDYEVGNGDFPKAGQQVTFNYIGYNESGRRIDSTYMQGAPARIRMGTNAVVPGFEEGIRDMKPGGKRRIVIPPELGPPVGPSTFFSSKQFEVFDIELLSIQNCQRRTIGFYSDVVCNEIE